MKAFDEWYIKHAKEKPWRKDSDFIKDAWRAALEWTLDMARTNEIHDAKVNIWEEIRNELKN